MNTKTETLNKAKIFNQELNYINNDKIRESAEVLIEMIPEYFFHEAASSTGKYHPEFSQGEGGLLRHTKAAVKIADALLKNNTTGGHFTSDEKDLIILSLILHDSVKRGNDEKYTRFDHPLLASKLVSDNKDKTKLTEEEISLIKSMIETHMGEWTKDYKGKEILEKPTTKYQRFVHMCDYLATQKFININFDENNDITTIKNYNNFWYNKESGNHLITGKIIDLNFDDENILIQTQEMGEIQISQKISLNLKVGQKVRILISGESLEGKTSTVNPLYFEIIN